MSKFHLNWSKDSVGMPPDQEILRNAKVQPPSKKRQSFAIPEPIQPPEVLGKRRLKLKMPKGASPPPPSTANKSQVSHKSKKVFYNMFAFEMFVNAIDSSIVIV